MHASIDDFTDPVLVTLLPFIAWFRSKRDGSIDTAPIDSAIRLASDRHCDDH
jgi:hypothetical protein